MSTITITPEQILNDRSARRAAGLAGCISGQPAPDLDFFGFRDVQIWNMDATGRMNGQEGFDPKNPCCMCFDHRDAFDPTGEVDAELVNEGKANALYTYRNLFPNMEIPVEQPVQQPVEHRNPHVNDNESPPPGGEPTSDTEPGLSNNPS